MNSGAYFSPSPVVQLSPTSRPIMENTSNPGKIPYDNPFHLPNLSPVLNTSRHSIDTQSENSFGQGMAKSVNGQQGAVYPYVNCDSTSASQNLFDPFNFSSNVFDR